MKSSLLSYSLGFLGLFLGLIKGIEFAEGMTGLTYLVMYCPTVILASLALGSVGFYVGRIIVRMKK